MGRASELRARYPFAEEVLRLYEALEEVWQESDLVTDDPIAHAAAVVLPRVVQATVAAGPPPLSEAASAFAEGAGGEDVVRAWAQGAEQSPVERYLGRASLGPVLEAMPPAPAAVIDDATRCPACGGPPQLSWYAPSGEALVSGRRHLLCSCCGHSWRYPRLACAGCGERAGAKLVTFGEASAFASAEGGVVRGLHAEPAHRDGAAPVFRHLQVEACDACRRYVIGVDLGRDAGAVPVVDELAALPLDLFARERGYQKVVPNLMGM